MFTRLLIVLSHLTLPANCFLCKFVQFFVIWRFCDKNVCLLDTQLVISSVDIESKILRHSQCNVFGCVPKGAKEILNRSDLLYISNFLTELSVLLCSPSIFKPQQSYHLATASWQLWKSAMLLVNSKQIFVQQG
jgi:hypothetical protein